MTWWMIALIVWSIPLIASTIIVAIAYNYRYAIGKPLKQPSDDDYFAFFVLNLFWPIVIPCVAIYVIFHLVVVGIMCAFLANYDGASKHMRHYFKWIYDAREEAKKKKAEEAAGVTT